MEHLYTVGCSTLSLDEFVRNLKQNNINVIADVRSVPYSHATPQFNREILKERLKRERILYGDFSKEFGARRSEPAVYEGNQVSFERTKELPEFSEGIKRIQKGLSMGYSIALMCTEKNPLDCHRFSLVARGIYEKTGLLASHILSNGSVVTTAMLEGQMLRKFGKEQDLFSSDTDRIREAYGILNKKIGYVLPQPREQFSEEGVDDYEKDIYMFG